MENIVIVNISFDKEDNFFTNIIFNWYRFNKAFDFVGRVVRSCLSDDRVSVGSLDVEDLY
jgi:hypothetical protein